MSNPRAKPKDLVNDLVKTYLLPKGAMLVTIAGIEVYRGGRQTGQSQAARIREAIKAWAKRQNG